MRDYNLAIIDTQEQEDTKGIRDIKEWEAIGVIIGMFIIQINQVVMVNLIHLIRDQVKQHQKGLVIIVEVMLVPTNLFIIKVAITIPIVHLTLILNR